MPQRDAATASTKRAINIVAIVFAVVMSMMAHHVSYAAQIDVSATVERSHHAAAGHHALHEQCVGNDCGHHGTTPGCCALGFCAGCLPEPDFDIALITPPINRVPAYPGIDLRWVNDGLERPPRLG